MQPQQHVAGHDGAGPSGVGRVVGAQGQQPQAAAALAPSAGVAAELPGAQALGDGPPPPANPLPAQQPSAALAAGAAGPAAAPVAFVEQAGIEQGGIGQVQQQQQQLVQALSVPGGAGAAVAPAPLPAVGSPPASAQWGSGQVQPAAMPAAPAGAGLTAAAAPPAQDGAAAAFTGPRQQAAPQLVAAVPTVSGGGARSLLQGTVPPVQVQPGQQPYQAVQQLAASGLPEGFVQILAAAFQQWQAAQAVGLHHGAAAVVQPAAAAAAGSAAVQGPLPRAQPPAPASPPRAASQAPALPVYSVSAESATPRAALANGVHPGLGAGVVAAPVATVPGPAPAPLYSAPPAAMAPSPVPPLPVATLAVAPVALAPQPAPAPPPAPPQPALVAPAASGVATVVLATGAAAPGQMPAVLYAVPPGMHSRKPEGHLMLKGLTAFDIMDLKHHMVLWCATNDLTVRGPDDPLLFSQFMKFVPPNKPFSGSLLRIWEAVKQRSDADPAVNPMELLWKEIGRQHSAELRAVTHEDVRKYLALRSGELLQDALQRLRNLLKVQSREFRITWEDAHRWFAEGIADQQLRIELGRRFQEKCGGRDPETAEEMLAALDLAVQSVVDDRQFRLRNGYFVDAAPPRTEARTHAAAPAVAGDTAETAPQQSRKRAGKAQQAAASAATEPQHQPQPQQPSYSAPQRQQPAQQQQQQQQQPRPQRPSAAYDPCPYCNSTEHSVDDCPVHAVARDFQRRCFLCGRGYHHPSQCWGPSPPRSGRGGRGGGRPGDESWSPSGGRVGGYGRGVGDGRGYDADSGSSPSRGAGGDAGGRGGYQRQHAEPPSQPANSGRPQQVRFSDQPPAVRTYSTSWQQDEYGAEPSIFLARVALGDASATPSCGWGQGAGYATVAPAAGWYGCANYATPAYAPAQPWVQPFWDAASSPRSSGAAYSGRFFAGQPMPQPFPLPAHSLVGLGPRRRYPRQRQFAQPGQPGTFNIAVSPALLRMARDQGVWFNFDLPPVDVAQQAAAARPPEPTAAGAADATAHNADARATLSRWRSGPVSQSAGPHESPEVRAYRQIDHTGLYVLLDHQLGLRAGDRDLRVRRALKDEGANMCCVTEDFCLRHNLPFGRTDFVLITSCGVSDVLGELHVPINVVLCPHDEERRCELKPIPVVLVVRGDGDFDFLWAKSDSAQVDAYCRGFPTPRMFYRPGLPLGYEGEEHSFPVEYRRLADAEVAATRVGAARVAVNMSHAAIAATPGVMPAGAALPPPSGGGALAGYDTATVSAALPPPGDNTPALPLQAEGSAAAAVASAPGLAPSPSPKPPAEAELLPLRAAEEGTVASLGVSVAAEAPTAGAAATPVPATPAGKCKRRQRKRPPDKLKGVGRYWLVPARLR